jgi:hypothetical protein
MIATQTTRRRRIRPLALALVGLVLVCCLARIACPGRDPTPAYDVSARPLELIRAGTAVGTDAPAGWTHLVLKSVTRPGAGDVGQLSASQARLAGLLFTAIVADVSREGGRSRLARVAVGVGTRVGGQDLVLTPDTQERLGADLGFVARAVLSRAHQKLADVVTLARSPLMAVFDAPNLMVRDGRHRPVVLRYAVLVDEKSGRLDALVWVLDRQEGGGLAGPVGPAQWLPPAAVDDCVLHVDAREFFLGSPNEKSFALLSPPKGQRQLEFPAALGDLASRTRFSPTAAAQLEVGLRALLGDTAGR